MNAVVHGVVSLDVPAVIVLIHTVAVDPQNRGMFFGAVEILGNKKPRGNLLTIGSGVMHKLRLDKARVIDFSRHGVGDSNGLCAFARRNGVEIGAVVRIRVLVNEMAVAFGPVGSNVRSCSRGEVRDVRLRGIVADGGNANLAVTGTIFEVGIERDARAVVRPGRTPGFKLALGDLYGIATGGGHHVKMIPTVLVAKKGNPLAVGRGPGLRAGLAPVGNAP